MQEYTTLIYDEREKIIGTLVFQAEDWWEADGIIDQYTIHHPGQYPDGLCMTSKSVQTPNMGEVHLN